MNNITLFTTTVLIWGTTWIAIAAQISEVPIIVSIFFRFALAGLIMLAGLAMMRRLKRPALWRFVVIQALCLFCFNFVGLYKASALIPSGLVSIVFSLASIFNAVNARLFFGDQITARTILAGSVGTIGLLLVFWRDLFANHHLGVLQGIGWAVFGTLMFSLGNMASRKNSGLGITPVSANAWGMGIGAFVLLIIILVSAQPLVLSTTPTYWLALVYLAVIGSVAGFTAYLVLAARIGSARAGYATVLFPIVALAISTVFEGYSWTPLAMIGATLTILGNVIMFWRPPTSRVIHQGSVRQ